jgi:mRNA interferase MazF
MGQFVKGDVVVAPFPYSDLTTSKKRPALVIALLEGDDVILCQITSKAKHDNYAIPLANTDFKSGSLHQKSFIRPNRLFTADARIVLYRAGEVKRPKIDEVIAKIIEILEA